MWQEVLTKYKGRKIAVWCARYVYAGTVESCGEQVLTLNPAVVVETTGEAKGAKPTIIDILPCAIHLNTDFIENVCTPTWLQAL